MSSLLYPKDFPNNMKSLSLYKRAGRWAPVKNSSVGSTTSQASILRLKLDFSNVVIKMASYVDFNCDSVNYSGSKQHGKVE